MTLIDLGSVKGDKGDTGNTGATGATGATGVGIDSIEQIDEDTFRLCLTNGDSYDIDMPPGGSASIVTSWETILSDAKVPSEKLTKNTIDTKVTGSKVTSWSSTVSDNNVPSEKLVKDGLDAIEDLIGDAITYINS